MLQSRPLKAEPLMLKPCPLETAFDAEATPTGGRAFDVVVTPTVGGAFDAAIMPTGGGAFDAAATPTQVPAGVRGQAGW